MPDRKRVHIVASPQGRAGTTLVARLLADHVLLAGGRCRLFDTDVAGRRLAAYFPEAAVIDIGRVADQMKLFDVLAAPSITTQVVDVAHHAFRRFFALAAQFDYFAEAKARGVEPVIFFVSDDSAAARAAGLALAAECRGAALVLVANASQGGVRPDAADGSDPPAPVAGHPQLRLGRLDPLSLAAMEDPRLSLSAFMRRSQSRQAPAPRPPAELSLVDLSLETRTAVAAWLRSAFQGIDRVLVELDLLSQLNAPDAVGT